MNDFNTVLYWEWHPCLFWFQMTDLLCQRGFKQRSKSGLHSVLSERFCHLPLTYTYIVGCIMSWSTLRLDRTFPFPTELQSAGFIVFIFSSGGSSTCESLAATRRVESRGHLWGSNHHEWWDQNGMIYSTLKILPEGSGQGSSKQKKQTCLEWWEDGLDFSHLKDTESLKGMRSIWDPDVTLDPGLQTSCQGEWPEEAAGWPSAFRIQRHFSAVSRFKQLQPIAL